MEVLLVPTAKARRNQIYTRFQLPERLKAAIFYSVQKPDKYHLIILFLQPC